MQDGSLTGIFQWSGEECFTKYSLAVAMADVFSLTKDHLTSDKNPPSGGTPRPYDAKLSSKRLQALGISRHTPFKDAIKTCLAPFAKK